MLIDALVVDVEQLGEEGQSLIAPGHQRRRKVRRCGGDSVLRGDDTHGGRIAGSGSHRRLHRNPVSSSSKMVVKWRYIRPPYSSYSSDGSAGIGKNSGGHLLVLAVVGIREVKEGRGGVHLFAVDAVVEDASDRARTRRPNCLARSASFPTCCGWAFQEKPPWCWCTPAEVRSA